MIIAVNIVILDLGEARARADYAAPLVLVDLIVGDVETAVEQDYAVAVVVDLIMLDPTETGLDGEDALGTRLVDQVVEDHGISRVVPAKRNVGLVVLEDLVLFDVATGGIYQEHALPVVAEDSIVQNLYLGALACSDARLPILCDVVVLFDSGVVLLPIN